MSCDPQCQKEIVGMADSLAGGFTLVTWIISLIQVAKHLKHYTNPFFQNKILSILFLFLNFPLIFILAIIFMAPFYALTSFLTLLTKVIDNLISECSLLSKG